MPGGTLSLKKKEQRKRKKREEQSGHHLLVGCVGQRERNPQLAMRWELSIGARQDRVVPEGQKWARNRRLAHDEIERETPKYKHHVVVV